MKRLTVDPYEVWCFYHCIGVDLSLARVLKKEGWQNTSPVPLFEIPEEHRYTHHKYMLASDGSHRWAAAFAVGIELPGVIYSKYEKINPRKDGINDIPSPDMSTEKRFDRILTTYLYPEEVRKRMEAAYKD